MPNGKRLRERERALEREKIHERAGEVVAGETKKMAVRKSSSKKKQHQQQRNSAKETAATAVAKEAAARRGSSDCGGQKKWRQPQQAAATLACLFLSVHIQINHLCVQWHGWQHGGR